MSLFDRRSAKRLPQDMRLPQDTRGTYGRAKGRGVHDAGRGLGSGYTLWICERGAVLNTLR